MVCGYTTSSLSREWLCPWKGPYSRSPSLSQERITANCIARIYLHHGNLHWLHNKKKILSCSEWKRPRPVGRRSRHAATAGLHPGDRRDIRLRDQEQRSPDRVSAGRHRAQPDQGTVRCECRLFIICVFNVIIRDFSIEWTGRRLGRAYVTKHVLRMRHDVDQEDDASRRPLGRVVNVCPRRDACAVRAHRDRLTSTRLSPPPVHTIESPYCTCRWVNDFCTYAISTKKPSQTNVFSPNIDQNGQSINGNNTICLKVYCF